MQLFLDILYAVLVLLGAAILFGVLLSIAGNVFNAEKPSKIDDIESLLAKSNCGGCGKAGCKAFAKALVEGKAEINDCSPTAKENKSKIAEVLGIKIAEQEETVAIVACHGGKQCENKYDYQGYGDCISCEFLARGVKKCESGCMGLSSCVTVCPYNALKINNAGVAVTDKNKCVSCGVCIKRCPKKLFVRIPKSAPVYIACANPQTGKNVRTVCKSGCIACNLCAKVCAANAITMVDNLPKIDYNKCTGCFLCEQKCPTKTIRKNI